MINHRPIFKDDVVDYLSEKEGVPIKYVITSEIEQSDVVYDIFYRDTPHPKFGNHYFGLRYIKDTGDVNICNADVMEGTIITMIEENGVKYYSQAHHDFVETPEGNFIDGGRAYDRIGGDCPVIKYRIEDGSLVHE